MESTIQNRNSTKHQRKATSFTGIALGEITLEKTGNLGFGYDPF
jgi:inosine/xanthosine triphosphate pyrophosphatase family protein